MMNVTFGLFSKAFSAIAILGLLAASGCASYGGGSLDFTDAAACSAYDSAAFPAKQNVARTGTVAACEETAE